MSDGLVLGIDFGATKVALALARPNGARLVEEGIDTRPEDGAVQAVTRSVGAARRLLAEAAGRDGGPLLAIGAVSPGVICPDRIALAPNVPGWEELRLGEMLREGLGIDEVRIGNDAKAAGLAEARWGALAGVRSGLFLNLGTGLSTALVLEGKVVEGAHGAAGEIGYQAPRWRPSAGHRELGAPLERLVSGRAFAERGSALLGRPVAAAELFAVAESDRRARRLIDEALQVLATHLANLAIALDPARIAVGGGLTHRRDVIFPVLEAALADLVPFPPELVPARFSEDAPLAGALVLAVDALGGKDLPRHLEPAEVR